MKLRWEKIAGSSGKAWWAFSGSLIVGHVVTRNDHTIGYTVNGVHMKHIGKGYGDVSSIASGKRAVERAWRQWLEAAGLVGA